MNEYVRPEIARMEGYVPGEQPRLGKVIKLNTNENPYPPSPAAVAAIRDAAGDGLARYPDPIGTSFRTRAAEVLGVEPDWILCGNGSDDILTIVTRAFVGEGDRLRIPYPSYILYRTLAQIQGATCEEIQFTSDWSLPESFAAPADRLRLAFLPNPNSPTGTVVPPEDVLSIAEQLPCPLVVDEAYADFAETNCIELTKQCDKILVTRTLSKSYALAGLRFGFVIGQPHMIAELAKVKDSYNCDALSIAGATAAIDDQDWLRENIQKVNATRERLTTSLNELGFSTIPSQANFVWCQHEKTSSEAIYRQLLESQVYLRYMKYPGWDEGLRISVGTDEQIVAMLGLLKGIVGS